MLTPALRVFLPIAAILMVPLAGASVRDPQTPAVVVLRNARLMDGDGRVVSARGAVVMRDGRIERVQDGDVPASPGAQIVDLAGRTVLPGLVNAHGHVADTLGLQAGAKFYTEENLRAQLRRYAEYGITTVASLGGDGPAGFALRDAEGTAPLDRARVRLAGPVITATSPAAAAAEVDRIAAMRPDLIKIRVDDNLGTAKKMPMEAARAVIERAHHHKLRVAVHIFYLDDAKALLRAGADFIAHSVRDRAVDEEFTSLLKSRNVCYSPTLTRELSTYVYETTPAFFDDPFFLRSADPAVLSQLRDPSRQAQVAASRTAQGYKAAMPVAAANLKTLHDAGVTIAFGTDTGPPGRFQGYFEHLELELMAQAGLSPAAIVAAATGNAARCLGLTDVGRLQPGARADLLVVRADPAAGVRALREIDSIWIGGARLPGR